MTYVSLEHPRTPARPTRGARGTARSCGSRPCPCSSPPTPRAAVERAADSSRTTHGAATAVDSCRYLASLILWALAGAAKNELLAPRYSALPGLWRGPLAPEVDEVAAGSFLRREPPEIVGSGYVVRSLEAALWAFARGGNFEEGALLAVNLGDDAETTGAVYGQLAGAHDGEAGIPAEWRSKLALLGTIEESPTGCTTPPWVSPLALYGSTTSEPGERCPTTSWVTGRAQCRLFRTIQTPESPRADPATPSAPGPLPRLRSHRPLTASSVFRDH